MHPIEKSPEFSELNCNANKPRHAGDIGKFVFRLRISKKLPKLGSQSETNAMSRGVINKNIVNMLLIVGIIGNNPSSNE